MTTPNEQQIGGEHYKKYPIQPWDYIMKNNIPWAEGCIIEWVTRWRDKGGVQDLEKAKHMIDKVIEMAAWSHEPIPLPTQTISIRDLSGLYNPDMVSRLAPRNIAKETTDPLCDSESRVTKPQYPRYEPPCDCERCSAE